MAEKLVKCKVIFDMATWSTRVPDTTPAQYAHNRAYKHQVVEIPQGEFDRLSGYGAVARLEDAAEALADVEAATGAVAEGEAGDLELAGYSAPDLIAYVTQHPEEKARVNRIESQRTKPRVTVMDATVVNQLDADALAADAQQQSRV